MADPSAKFQLKVYGGVPPVGEAVKLIAAPSRANLGDQAKSEVTVAAAGLSTGKIAGRNDREARTAIKRGLAQL